GPGGLVAVGSRAEGGMQAAQLSNGVGEVADLPLAKRNLIETFFSGQPQGARGAFLPRDHLADLAQGKSECLSFENQANAVAIAFAVDAQAPDASRGNQPLALVKAQRSRSHPDRRRQLCDAEFKTFGGRAAVLVSPGRRENRGAGGMLSHFAP